MFLMTWNNINLSHVLPYKPQGYTQVGENLPPTQFEHLGKTCDPEDSLLALSALWLAPNNKACFYRQNRGAEDGEM